MKKRIYYSKDFKYQTLLDVANGKKIEDILRLYGVDIDSALKRDKKYCSKLLYKWKKELNISNKENKSVKNTQSMLKALIQILDDNNVDDVIIKNTKDKIMKNVAKYKNLKNRVMTSYPTKNKIIKK